MLVSEEHLIRGIARPTWKVPFRFQKEVKLRFWLKLIVYVVV